MYDNKINDYFLFTIVRNPYDRILSYYFWSQGKNAVFSRCKFINFVNNKNCFQHKLINKNFHIIHFENLINELKDIECFKGIVDFNNYPKINSSINTLLNYNEIYDKELKYLVYNKYKKDFELFGYSY